MARMNRRTRQRVSQQAIVSLTPLIDTALTLLVIFMVATPVMHRGLKIELPKGNINEMGDSKKGSDDNVVHLDASERLYWNGDLIEKNQLMEKLRQKVDMQPIKMVTVKADEGVPFGTVYALVDAIKSVGGISCVALASQKPRV